MKRNLAIMLHDINDAVWFERLLHILIKKYKIISIDEFLTNSIKEYEKPFCIITADDGRKSFYKIVYPLILKYNVPSCLYISPEIIKSNRNYWFQDVQMMKIENLAPIIANYLGLRANRVTTTNAKEIMKLLQIEDIIEIIKLYKNKYKNSFSPQNISLDNLFEMKKSGLVQYGAHTQTHPILSNESDERSHKEIKSSINELSNLTGNEVLTFAYPNGNPLFDFGEREKTTLRKLGIVAAFSTRTDFISNDEDMYDIPRIGISYGNSYFIKAKLLLGKKWNIIKSLKNMYYGVERESLKNFLNAK